MELLVLVVLLIGWQLRLAFSSAPTAAETPLDKAVALPRQEQVRQTKPGTPWNEGKKPTVWFSDPRLGLVIGAAMITNLMVAGLAGTLIPLGLARRGIDPAVASGVLLTTVTDVVGFLAFLGLAALVLL